MKGNTPIEVMAAIVANGGPLMAWVRDYDDDDDNWHHKYVTGCDLSSCDELFYTSDSCYQLCSLTDPHQTGYKPIPTEWTYTHSNWRAVDHNGRLLEFIGKPVVYGPNGGWINVLTNEFGQFVSTDHDPTNWRNSLEQRKRKMRHMTPLEGYEFLAEGHEGKPRVWRCKTNGETTWFGVASLISGFEPRRIVYANLSDRDGEKLIWSEFPMVEDKS